MPLTARPVVLLFFPLSFLSYPYESSPVEQGFPGQIKSYEKPALKLGRKKSAFELGLKCTNWLYEIALISDFYLAGTITFSEPLLNWSLAIRRTEEKNSILFPAFAVKS